MDKPIQIFDYKFQNDEIEQEFENFFQRNGLMPLFTNDYRTSQISVSYVEARSVINGKYNRTLKDFSDILLMATDNKSYEEAIFQVIDKTKSFQGLMNNIKKIIRQYQQTYTEHMYNFWNIVWYNKELI